jgi:hypothetical protein
MWREARVSQCQNAQLESITSFTRSDRSISDQHANQTDPIVVWQLRRSDDDLLCATVRTTYGYALALALSGELVIFELEPNLERLARKAHRLETRLLARGWMPAGTQ